MMFLLMIMTQLNLQERCSKEVNKLNMGEFKYSPKEVKIMINKIQKLAVGNLSFCISIVENEFRVMQFSVKPKEFLASKDLETAWHKNLDNACVEMIKLKEKYYDKD